MEQTLKISDTGNSGTIEFIRKRRNDVPVVIEIDPFTDHTRHIRMDPEQIDQLIHLLRLARGLVCECEGERTIRVIPSQEMRCRACHKDVPRAGD